ncbi:MAG: alpha/beta fold hydrolase [Methanothermobacter sp.]|nr:alpha/beta fold hydrolase [Methanothermobacter sp.]
MMEEIPASYFKIEEFQFESGEKIQGAPVEYRTTGNPSLDDMGVIDNAVIYIHGWSGDCSSVRRIAALTEPGGALENFFVISISSLGSPGSASPSTTAMGKDFPEYTILDMVNFQRQFLDEKFGIRKVRGVIGTSMGGFQALQWAAEYPDEMEFLIPLVTSWQVRGINYALFSYMNHLIEGDPEFRAGTRPERALSLASMLMYLHGLSREYYQGLENAELESSMMDMGSEGALMDPYDVIWRNRAAMKHDLSGKLESIRARTLIFGVNQDRYFPPELDTIPMAQLIPKAELVLFDSECGHLGVNEIGKYNEIIVSFIGGD